MTNDLLERVIRLFVREAAAGNYDAAERWAVVAFGLLENRRLEGLGARERSARA
jgi:hypothetical protein